ncbi:RelE/StbE family addiction module toxin [Streptococcus pneumoniae]|nr:RelE/StbE family addiction module toxin [Streptococcus pneumoniae]
MLKIRYHKQFKKDFKLAMKRGLKAELLEEVLNFLVQEKEHPARYRDHSLTASKHFSVLILNENQRAKIILNENQSANFYTQ